MADIKLSEVTASAADGLPSTFAAQWANATARLAATAFPGGSPFAALDNGKRALDIDTGRIFILADYTGPTWIEDLSSLVACTAANLASASADGFESATHYLRIRGVAGADVSVATGAGYVTLQTTAAVLSAVNTCCDVSFKIRYNEALASKVVRTGSLAVMVARLDDGDQTIQSLASGLPETGATPVLTGTLQTGVGWQATLNADGTVTIALAQDAAIARSAKSRYYVDDLDTQVAP
jgi:hypothetical protein